MTFQEKMQARREWHNIFEVLKEKTSENMLPSSYSELKEQ